MICFNKMLRPFTAISLVRPNFYGPLLNLFCWLSMGSKILRFQGSYEKPELKSLKGFLLRGLLLVLSFSSALFVWLCGELFVVRFILLIKNNLKCVFQSIFSIVCQSVNLAVYQFRVCLSICICLFPVSLIASYSVSRSVERILFEIYY